MPDALLRVEVRCTELPKTKEPVYLGIQRGKDVIDQVPADDRRATFVAEFRVEKRADGSPNFLGPFAHGTAADRFIYLSWGVQERTESIEMFRRLKIRLGHLEWPAIRRAIARQVPLVVNLRLTDGKGGPLCATPPPTHIRWDVG